MSQTITFIFLWYGKDIFPTFHILKILWCGLCIECGVYFRFICFLFLLLLLLLLLLFYYYYLLIVFQDGTSLKLVDKFTYLGSSVSSTEKDIDTRLTKAWTAIDRLSIKWKSNLTDKMKRSFFQAAVVSILLYGCTTWTLTKRLEKKLDDNYTRMLRAILNKSW